MPKQNNFSEDGLHVYIQEQRLYCVKDLKVEVSYPVSTSKNPPSCQMHSGGTPWGKHEIAEKIGDGAEKGMVFKGRIPIGKKYWEDFEGKEGGLITSRILWLRGLEPGINAGENCDTYARYVYIHGTHKEEAVGAPFSQGCINMKNEDVIDLYGRVRVGDRVFIYT